ncbi:MotA/TolQ/ExbB proton channel family protein [Leptospira kirschneri]|uniref:Transporter, MotA/TolQ/ExbB proton channel family protein n=1 Tax=Leptospira kirschneri str. 200802841 TaxID=1193047 RepID=A0A828XQS3_9LEPT|nr:MotA/TolQ/ExbB proton channel family protein [Leptospira kirschneri]EMO75034.1 transporter, MotA/TolQ/ExbB proton channel family protein [Leptospira kirschneri str. 200801925]EKO49494.1 transporter, MotA/TolQ/ExbB proton channel family protein [Leptospira kirschneri str. 200802841]EKQ85700.1 transporter, MotA/TolQ/ExbB proton channel family protein [Leptospira kirschneri serovar Grippotyphosa str. Moskva]EKR09421.1 transporter, MotA/TolQ/ExbB proton channel family protein [Leptospira kirschn
MTMFLVEYGETFIFVIMLVASIVALAVGTERILIFRRNLKNTEAILPVLTSEIRKGDFSAIKSIASENRGNIYAKFSQFSAEHYEIGHEALSELQEGKIIGERVELENHLPILNTLGNNAPFIGLLGTVLGVIKAFYGLGTLGSTGAEFVMRSISTALLATAAGLGVAIPVVMANNYFTRKLKVIQANLEILSKEFLASLSRKK